MDRLARIVSSPSASRRGDERGKRRLRLLELRSLGSRWCRERRSLQHHRQEGGYSRGPQPENSHLTNEEMSPQVLSTAFLILCALVLYQLALIFAPFFTPILWALILARLFYPLYQYLLRLLRGQATLSAFLSTLAVTFVAVLPVAYVAFLAITETIHAYQTAMTWLQNGGLKRLPCRALGFAFHRQHFAGTAGTICIGLWRSSGIAPRRRKSRQRGPADWCEWTRKEYLRSHHGFLHYAVYALLFFRDGHRLYDAFYDAVPIDEGHKAAIFDRLTQTMIAVVRGTLLTALAQGVAAGLTYWVLNVPFPVFLGSMSALFSLLPFGGTALVWVPVATYLFWTAPLWKGIVMIVWAWASSA